MSSECKNPDCEPTVGCSKKLRTQTSIAKALGISRQAVNRLVKNKERTKIPMQNDQFGDYITCEAVKSWYLNDFEPGRGPNSGIRAAALSNDSE